MEITFELISGVSVGFELVTDTDMEMEDDERAIIIVDFFLFRALITVLK